MGAGFAKATHFTYVEEKPWHSLGIKVEGTGMTTKQAMTNAELGYTVDKQPIYYMNASGEMVCVPDKQGLIHSVTNECMGVVGSDYEVINNDKVFSLIDDFVGESGAIVETAGQLFNGRQVFAVLNMNKVCADMAIMGWDTRTPYLLFHTGHDGQTAFTATASSVRTVCQNTVRLAMASGTTTLALKHTSGNKDLRELRTFFKLSKKSWEIEADLLREYQGIGLHPGDALTYALTAHYQRGERILTDPSKKTAYQAKILTLFESLTEGEETNPNHTVNGLFNCVTRVESHCRGFRETENKADRKFKQIALGNDLADRTEHFHTAVARAYPQNKTIQDAVKALATGRV